MKVVFVKKVIFIFLLICLFLTFAACDNSTNSTENSEKDQNNSTTSTTSTTHTTNTSTNSESTTHVHAFGQWVVIKAATCTDKGEQERSCSCGAKEFQSIDSIGHTAGKWITDREATCTDTGSKRWVCSVCNETIKTEQIPAKGHKFSEWKITTQPTAYQHGEEQRSCSACKKTETKVIVSNASILSYRINSDLKTCTITGVKEMRNTNIIIPDNIDGYTVTKIAVNAFKGTTITSLTIPDNVIEIGSQAFEECLSLRYVTIGKGVTNVDNFSFRDCTSLLSITVDEDNKNYKSIDGNLYSKDGKEFIQYATGKTATSFTVPYGVEKIDWYAFQREYSLKNITLPSSVTYIGSGAFQSCVNLTSINIPSSVNTIMAHAFNNCGDLISVAFESASGWSSVLSAGMSTTTTFSSDDLSDKTLAAQYLRDDYKDYHWSHN